MSGDLLAALRRWESLRAERDRIVAEMREAAGPLEAAARALPRSGGLAELIKQDADGRVRFMVGGMGEASFALEELAGGA